MNLGISRQEEWVAPEPKDETIVSIHLRHHVGGGLLKNVMNDSIVFTPQETMWTTVFREIPPSRIPAIDISDEKDFGSALEAITFYIRKALDGEYQLLDIGKHNIEKLQFLVSPDLHPKICATLRQSTPERIEANRSKSWEWIALDKLSNQLPSLKKLSENILYSEQPEDTVEVIETQNFSPPRIRFIDKNIETFAISAIVGGTWSSGAHVYTNYQKSQKLPLQYSAGEWQSLALRVLHDSTKHGISGVISQNLVDIGVHPFASSATVGAMNGLYDSYFNGDLKQLGFIPITANAATASLVSGIGAYIGRAAVESVPVAGKTLPVQLAASITGSLIGQALYQYLAASIAHVQREESL